MVIFGGRDDDDADEPKKPVGCFLFVASFFSFLVVFPISRSKNKGVPVQIFLGIQTIRITVSPTMVQIC